MNRDQVRIGMKVRLVYPATSDVVGTELVVKQILEEGGDQTIVNAIVTKVLPRSRYKLGQNVGRYIWKLKPIKSGFKDWAKEHP